jgi:hypothetical protein
VKSQRPRSCALLNYFFQADERSAADEQYVRCVHRRKFLVRMFAPALWRHIGYRAFENLQ